MSMACTTTQRVLAQAVVEAAAVQVEVILGQAVRKAKAAPTEVVTVAVRAVAVQQEASRHLVKKWHKMYPHQDHSRRKLQLDQLQRYLR